MDFITIMEWIGTIAFAVSGAVIAIDIDRMRTLEELKRELQVILANPGYRCGWSLPAERVPT